MPRPGRLLSVLALVGVAVVPLASAESQPLPCQCTFTSADPPDCVAYGQLGDGELIPWTVASQDCLDLYKIKDEAIDPATLAGMFPNPDGSGGSSSAFVNYLRFDDGSVASGIKAGFPQFWEESATTAGKMELKDEITVNGETVACTSELGGTESDCYNAMKDYFAVDPGAAEMAGVGQQLHNAAAVSREKEQSLVRIRLCEEGGAAECGATSEQVLEVKAANPDKFCSAYALGPAGYSYPKCVVDVGIIGSGPTTPPGSSAAVSLKFVGTAALILLGAPQHILLR